MGRIESCPDRELFDNELVRRHELGFQKVMTRDLRYSIRNMPGAHYPVEVEECYAKTLERICARKIASYLQLGD